MKFIDTHYIPIEALDKSYNYYLVILSIIIAILSTFTAFGTTERIQSNSDHLEQTLWLIFGASSMGIGIWAMHFIGSLALQLAIPVSYNLSITLISVIPAILASSVVLWLMSRAEYSLKNLLFSGILMGAGIGTMHYTGMAAMELNAHMLYSPAIFVLSLVVAVILATIALNIQYQAVQNKKYLFVSKKQTLSAVIMGFAVSGMHYTAMYAVEFVPTHKASQLITGVDATGLSIIISVVVLLILALALIVPHLLRYKQMVRKLQHNEENLKIAAIAFQTHEAILVTDAETNIIRINKAFTRITGYTEADIIGKTPKILNSGEQSPAFYTKYWDQIIHDGKWSGEIWNKHKNGNIYPEWQTVSAVYDDEGKVTHYISFFSDITEFKLAEKEIESLAFYDALTGLPNRRLLHERMEHELKMAERYTRAGIVFFLDLDGFKYINDSLGHSVGDSILIEAASRLQSLLRNTDTAVRLGGDEFIILTSPQDGLHNDLLAQSQVVAKKIIHEFNKPFLVSEHELFITASIGIALYTGIDETVDILLKRADAAMYQAKKAGRNTFKFYQESMQEVIDARVHMERHLRGAVANNEFTLQYQPQVSASNEIVGAEALIRWQNSELGFVSPVDFIPVSEETGVIIPISYWIVKTVCIQIKEWEEQGVYIPHIAINISAKQFHQPDFASNILSIVKEQNITPDKIVLEITESVFLGNIEEAIEKMNALKERGFKFSIDDFGTGYSSLTYLKRLPFDQLKIDQSFVRGLDDNKADAAIVKAIVVMAKSMSLNLIAEGVETDRHLAYLSGYGCHYYQGYYFSRPLTAEKMVDYVKNHSKFSL